MNSSIQLSTRTILAQASALDSRLSPITVTTENFIHVLYSSFYKFLFYIPHSSSVASSLLLYRPLKAGAIHLRTVYREEHHGTLGKCDGHIWARWTGQAWYLLISARPCAVVLLVYVAKLP